MKVLLLKDVYNLGRAGDVKKVADGYGRNFLVPQGLAVLATKGALKQAEYIRRQGEAQRQRLNKELSSVAEQIEGLELAFGMKAGETGKLYGSVTPAMIADEINAKGAFDVNPSQVDSQPIKLLGIHTARVRLTIDLIPEISIIVHREGESPESVMEEELVADQAAMGEFEELQAELEMAEAEEALDAELEDLDDVEPSPADVDEDEEAVEEAVEEAPEEDSGEATEA